MIVEMNKKGIFVKTDWLSDEWCGVRFEVEPYDKEDDSYKVIRCLHDEFAKRMPIGYNYLPSNLVIVRSVGRSKIGSVTINVGIPGSGKSTETFKKVDAGNGKIKRVNRDDIRAMVDNGKWSKANEKLIKEIEKQTVLSALDAFKDVIVDDTNCIEETVQWIKDFVHEYNPAVPVMIDDSFLDVPLKECLRRNALREGSARVPDDVIRRFYSQAVKTYVPDDDLPRAFIFDIDGTLAHMGKGESWGRGPHEYHKVLNDRVDPIVKMVLQSVEDSGAKIIILTGRKDICEEDTVQWLKDNNIYYDAFHIRKNTDQRRDDIIKKEIFFMEIAHKYNVVGVFDDRDQVVKMWRGLGIKCFQVNYGDF